MRTKACCRQTRYRIYVEISFLIALLGLLRVGTADVWPVPEQQWYSPGVNMLFLAGSLFVVGKLLQLKSRDETEEQ